MATSEELFRQRLAVALDYTKKIVVESDGYPMMHSANDIRTLLVGAFLAGMEAEAHVAHYDPTKVTRLEVIDEQGRRYTRWNCGIELSYQDEGRTLKVFVNGQKKCCNTYVRVAATTEQKAVLDSCDKPDGHDGDCGPVVPQEAQDARNDETLKVIVDAELRASGFRPEVIANSELYGDFYSIAKRAYRLGYLHASAASASSSTATQKQEKDMEALDLPSPAHSFDATIWAESFVAHVQQRPSIATDEGTMLGWFASALMRGYDEAQRRRDVQDRELLGFLSAEIPELHRVEVPRLEKAYQAFLNTRDPDSLESRQRRASITPSPQDAQEPTTPSGRKK